ncbi:MAG: TonB-dependent receptor [Pseudomonadota bacterium]
MSVKPLKKPFNKHQKTLLVPSISALALIYAMQASSETNDAEKPVDQKEEIEEITVYGVKLKSPVQELDTSVEVFDSERLDRERIIDISDVFLKTPNVTGNGGNNGQISIRGISREGLTGRGATSNVYVDGAPISGQALISGTGSLWDVEQVEVLRGSQSSVQGRNALAGAVVLKTADPTFEPEFKSRLTYSRFDTTEASLAASGALVDKELAGRLSIDHRESEGFVENLDPTIPDSGRETLTSRVKLLFTPSALPEFETKLTIDHTDSQVEGRERVISSGQSIDDDGFFDFNFFDYKTVDGLFDSEITSTRIISESSYELNDAWILKAILTNEDTDRDLLVEASNVEGDTEVQLFSGELRAEFEFGSTRGLIGAYYFTEEADSFSQASVPSFFDEVRGGALLQLIQAGIPAQNAAQIVSQITIDPVDSLLRIDNDVKLETENYALFGQIEWSVNEHVSINAGFRYDKETYSDPTATITPNFAPENCQLSAPGVVLGVPTQPLVTLSCLDVYEQFVGATSVSTPAPDESFNAFLPRLSVTYKFDDDHFAFASYQRGYRAGGSNVEVITSLSGDELTRENLTYDPEYLDTFEVGSRNTFLDKKLIANISIFYSSYEDQQITFIGEDDDTPFNTRILNAGETTFYGAEFLLDYTPTDNLNVYASVGLLETEFDDFVFATQGEFQNLEGNEMPAAPDLTFTLGSSYTMDSGFYMSAAYSYIGEQHSDPTNLDSDDFRQAFLDAGLDPELGAQLTEVIESRADLTMRVGYEFRQGFNVYAFGTNLLDDETLTRVNYADVDQTSGLVNFRNDAGGLANKPRSLGMGVDYIF